MKSAFMRKPGSGINAIRRRAGRIGNARAKADRRRTEVMNTVLICPQCATRYETAADIPAEGRKVRCSQCTTIWHVMPEHDPVGEAASAYRDEAPHAPAAAEPTVTPAARPLDDDEIVFRPDPEEDGKPPEASAQEPPKEAPEPVKETAKLWPAASPERRPERPETRPTPVAFGSGPLPRPASDPPKPSAMATSYLSRGAVMSKRAGIIAGWAGLGLGIAAVAIGFFAAPQAVVAALPGAARLYDRMGIAVNLRGLAFDNVTYNWIEQGGRPALDVTGEIVNLTGRAIEPPPVLFALRDGEAAEVFQWAARVRDEPLAAGERAEFSARIPSPPGAVRSLQVRFARGQ